MLLKARTGLVKESRQVNRGGKTYTTTVWVRKDKKKKGQGNLKKPATKDNKQYSMDDLYGASSRKLSAIATKHNIKLYSTEYSDKREDLTRELRKKGLLNELKAVDLKSVIFDGMGGEDKALADLDGTWEMMEQYQEDVGDEAFDERMEAWDELTNIKGKSASISFDDSFMPSDIKRVANNLGIKMRNHVDKQGDLVYMFSKDGKEVSGVYRGADTELYYDASDVIEDLSNVLRKFGVTMKPDPVWEGSDTYGVIFVNKRKKKK